MTNSNKAPEESAVVETSLYASRVEIYARSVQGFFRRLKWGILVTLLGLYWGLPWLRWDRGPGAPDQALLIDLPGRRGYFFFIEIWPQEVYYLTGLLIIAAIGLFLMTALLGRVWCGYTCVQTVWTDLFMLVERLIEGDRNARIKLDRAPMSLSKAAKKLAKHAAWLLIAAGTGGAWVLYFADAPTVVREMLTLQASSTVWITIACLTGSTYVLAGWAREQLCIYMCPWPRFQAAMFDEDSLIVTYESWRGEPRGFAKKRKTEAELSAKRGDCVDCRACVNVCPTGTDIRLGPQLSCINCGLCADACDEVMDKFKLPRGLIAYDSINNGAARVAGLPTQFRLIRPRTVTYGLLVVLVAGIMGYSLISRATLEVNVLRDRNPMYITLSDGGVRNGYTLKILNKAREKRQFTLGVDRIKDATITVVGGLTTGSASVPLDSDGDTVATYKVFVRLPPASLTGDTMPMTFVLTELGGKAIRHDTTFVGPAR